MKRDVQYAGEHILPGAAAWWRRCGPRWKIMGCMVSELRLAIAVLKPDDDDRALPRPLSGETVGRDAGS